LMVLGLTILQWWRTQQAVRRLHLWKQRAVATEEALVEADARHQRLSKDTEEEGHRSLCEALRQVLALDDAIQAALEHAEGPTEDVQAGIALLARESEQVWRRLALTVISPSPGSPFDPHLHEAIHCEAREDFGPGTIVQVRRRGFSRGETLVRPAQVICTSASAQTASASPAAAAQGSASAEVGDSAAPQAAVGDKESSS